MNITPEKAAAMLEALEQLVKNGTEGRGRDMVIMYDEEDGFWLSSIERGAAHGPVKDISPYKRETLAEAVAAAVEWHNHEVSRRKPWISTITPLEP